MKIFFKKFWRFFHTRPTHNFGKTGQPRKN